MRFTLPTALLVLSSGVTNVAAYWKGFNVGANNPDGSCKTQEDWKVAFQTLQGLPGYFSSVRLYASSDCDTLARAVPAAIEVGTKILVGVWSTDDAHFTAEKNALAAAINTYGHDWIVAISVGSEDLYRKDQDPNALAGQIYDVRGMVRQWGVTQDVGHVDTWNAWVDGANAVVIQACDFVGTDGYPYFQAATIESSPQTFWDSVQAVRNVVNTVKPGIWVWVTETGQPLSGPNYGASVASLANAQKYWKEVACAAFEQVHIFWYAYQDYTSSPSFGVVDANHKALYDLSC